MILRGRHSKRLATPLDSASSAHQSLRTIKYSRASGGSVEIADKKPNRLRFWQKGEIEQSLMRIQS
jgi:hypothetical protein